MSDATPRLAWGHININVSNLERSVEFYKKLGFEMFLPGIPYLGLTTESGSKTMPEDSALALGLAIPTRGRACIMQLGRGFPKLDLTELSSSGQAKPLANVDLGIVRLCLGSQDLQSDFARLTGEGVAFLSAPQIGKDGLADIAICADPDGTLIELLQLHLDKWPGLPPGE